MSPVLLFDPAGKPASDADVEWKRLRRLGVGASEVGVLTGTAKFGSKYQLYCDKLGLLPDREQTERMSMGKRMERTIMECLVSDESFQEEYGCSDAGGPLDWQPCQRLYSCEAHPLVLATPDALVDFGQEHLMVECKNTRWDEAWADGPPAYVIDQVQQQMLVMDKGECIVAWLLHGDTFKWVTVKADPQRQALIVRSIEDFWTHHILQEIPPQVTDADTQALKDRYQKADLDPVALPGEFIALDERKAILERQVKDAEREIEEIRNQFRAAIGNSEAGMLPNGVVYRASVVVKKEFTVKATSYKELRRVAPKENK